MITKNINKLFVVLFTILIFVSIGFSGNDNIWRVPPRHAKKKNPIPATQESITKGKILYVQHCVSCHGEDGKGDGPAAKDLKQKPADHTNPKMWDASDGSIFWKISVGKTPMPSFKPLIVVDGRWHIINYFRTLATKPKGTPPKFNIPESFRSTISKVVKQYSNIKKYLIKNNYIKAQSRIIKLEKILMKLSELDYKTFPKESIQQWNINMESFKTSLNIMKQATSITNSRIAFKNLSDALNIILINFGHAEKLPLRVIYCDIVFEKKGAIWIQGVGELKNPYLGKQDLYCGKEQNKLGAMQDFKKNKK